MAVRTATLRYPDPFRFLADQAALARTGTLLLPTGTVDGEPAPELKVDLVIPTVGRIGPLVAQVMSVLPDGSVATRVLEIPEAVTTAAEPVLRLLAAARDHLLRTGEVGPAGNADPAELARLAARVAELEAQLREAEARRAQAVRAAIQSPPAERPSGDAPEGVAGLTRRPRGLPLPPLDPDRLRGSGSLDDGSLRDFWMTAAVEKRTGILTIRLDSGRVRHGFWSKGGPVGWRTEPIDEEEVLGVLLLRSGQITREQLAESLRVMHEQDVRQGEALIDLGLINFAQLVLLLQKQAEFVFQRVVNERGGTWSFHGVDELPERFLNPPIRVASYFYRQLRARAKVLPAEELAESLRPLLDRYVYVAPGSERILEEMRLTAEEQGFIKIVSQTSYRLRELSSVSNLPRSVTAMVVWCLRELNLLEFRSDEATARVEARVAQALGSRRAIAQKGTLFERLDIHWICTTRDVEAAYRKLSAEFPARDYGRFGPEWTEAVELITRRIEEAYQQLRVDAERREYRRTVIERPMIEQSAQLLAAKGEMAVMKQNWPEAFECYSKAVELMPQVPEYRDGLQRATAAGGGPG